jgi:hypothetical protein
LSANTGRASAAATRLFIHLAILPNETSSRASVLMMEATDMRNGNDISLVWQFN